MKKVLLDTNIVLDGIAAREPFRESAEAIFRLIRNKKITGCITASGVTDIYYISRKSRSEPETRDALRILLNTFSIIDVRGNECRDALESPLDDYEDALLVACGIKAGIDCIVTRDKHLLNAKKTGVGILSPESFLNK